MKSNNKKYISIALSVLVMIVVFVLLFKSYNDELEATAEVKAQSESIQAEIDELNGLMVELESLQGEKKQVEEKVDFLLSHYGLVISPETSIRLIRSLENATGTKVRSMSFGTESVFFTSELQITEEGPTLTGYRSQLNISYETSYGNFKRLMDYIADYPERMNVESVTASFNGASGYLSGNMTLNLYRLDGTGREYVPPVEPEVPLGVENIFGTLR